MQCTTNRIIQRILLIANWRGKKHRHFDFRFDAKILVTHEVIMQISVFFSLLSLIYMLSFHIKMIRLIFPTTFRKINL